MTKRRTYNAPVNGPARGMAAPRPTEAAAPVAGPDLTGIDWASGGRKASGGRRTHPDDYVALSSARSGKQNGSTSLLLSLRLPLMQTMGWRIGDRCLVALTADRAWLVVRRDMDGSGYRLGTTVTVNKEAMDGRVASASTSVLHPVGVGPWPHTCFRRDQLHIDLAAQLFAIPLAVRS